MCIRDSYATFPPKLIAPLIRASVPRRCCPECGMAWAPVVERAEGETFRAWRKRMVDEGQGGRWKDAGTTVKPNSDKSGYSIQQYYRDVFNHEGPIPPEITSLRASAVALPFPRLPKGCFSTTGAQAIPHSGQQRLGTDARMSGAISFGGKVA